MPVAEADALICENMPVYPQISCSLDAVSGTVLREDIFAERDEPPFDRVMMDGIAIRYSDWFRGVRTFRICGEQPAGRPGEVLDAESGCFEVMTGAVLPTGADCVIPLEQIDIVDDSATLKADVEPKRGQFIHQRASDRRAGDELLSAGTVIGGPEMIILASAGKGTVAVTRRPSFSVISTGDELVDVDQPIESHQIRRSNDRGLDATLKRHGLEDVRRDHLRDDPDLLSERIAQHLKDTDVLILSGGVSMGRCDHIPQILQELGVEVVFHKIAQKPGKPMWFGVSRDGKPVFALPGNPVSSLVCLVRYVIPAVCDAMQARSTEFETVRLSETVRFRPSLTYFVPVRIRNNGGVVEALPRPPQNSGDFAALAGTDGIIELPEGRNEYPRGFSARLYRW